MMLYTRSIENSPIHRCILWGMIYIFFFQMISQTALSYVDTTAKRPTLQFELRSVWKRCMDFLVRQAAAADEINGAIDTEGNQVEPSTQGNTGSGSGVGGAGQGGVDSQMGAYTYNYPLEVPPGRGGFAPSLALNYNSLAPNGWLGRGWSLGMGSIQRSTKDGQPGYTDADTFVIHIKGTAVTLVREGTARVNGVDFRLKNEGMFLKIVKNGDVWTALDKAGNRYIFGEDDNSRQYGSNGIFKWSLTRTEDANGNAVVFTYDCDTANNRLYLRRISYDVNNYIVFESDPQKRLDAPVMFTDYFKTRTVRRLKYIRMYNGAVMEADLVRSYELNYVDNNTTRDSFLKTITLSGSRGGKLPPVNLGYTTVTSVKNSTFKQVQSEDEAQFWSETLPAPPPTAGRPMVDPSPYPRLGYYRNVVSADFTGDGKDDLFLSSEQSQDQEGWWRVLASTAGGFNPVPIAGQSQNFARDHIFYPAELNGDGKADLFARPVKDGVARILLSTGVGFTQALTNLTLSEKEKVYFLDINGDGRNDLLTTYSYHHSNFPETTATSFNSGWHLYLRTDDGFKEINSGGGAQAQTAFYADRAPVIGDFNGDGKSDFMLFLTLESSALSDTETWISNGSNVVKAQAAGLNFSKPADMDPWRYISWLDKSYAGDYNGDGKTDVLTIKENNVGAGYAGYHLFISTGNEFKLVNSGDIPTTTDNVHVGDYNGDGRSDLLVAGDPEDNNAWNGYRLLLSKGEDFVQVAADPASPVIESLFTLGDFNGDNRTDFLVRSNQNENQTAAVYLARISPSDALAQSFGMFLGSVTDPLGATTQITYLPSSRWAKAVDNDGNPRYMPMILPTVATLAVSDNMPVNGHSAVTAYAYQGGRYDPVERQFRGYAKVSAADRTSRGVTHTYYHQDPRYPGCVAMSASFDGNGKRVLTTHNRWHAYEFVSETEKDKRTFPFISESIVKQYDGDSTPLATITTDYTYDRFGNVLTEDKSVFNEKTGLEESRLFTRITYHNDPDTWILGKPETIRVDHLDPGSTGAPALRETRYTYHPDRPWLRESETRTRWNENGAELFSTTYYDYDIYGNATRVSSPRNADWTVTTSYDGSDGMFPDTITNALGQTISQQFDPRFGVVVSRTDANGRTTTTLYDQFGRPDRITFPDNSFKDYDYHIEPGNHWVTEKASLLPTVKTSHDNFNRVVKKTLFDGTRTIVTDTLYDNRGRVSRESLPYFPNNTVYHTVYAYDNRDRLVKQTHPDGTFRSMRYVGFDEIVTGENSQVHRMKKDALGRLVQVTEPTGGITKYDYDPFDNLIWVEDPLGAQTQIYYDELGRKISMDDPYMGHWEYLYDEAGNLIRQIDGEGREVTLTYDELDRLETKNSQGSGKIIEYGYDEARSGYFNIGRLTTLTATEPGSLFNTITFNYDPMGRTKNKTRTIDGEPYTTEREFDPAGRLTRLTYPRNSARVEYRYTPMGHLDGVDKIESDNSRYPVVQYGNYNALGQMASVTYGNGARTDYTYHAGNFRLQTLQTRAEDGAIQDLEYLFDNAGNVAAINDNLNGAAYDYEYDGLNRLQRATAVCSSDPQRAYEQTYTYDLAGNMTAKSGRGGFEVLSWKDAEKHLMPEAVRYADAAAGVGSREIQYNQENMPTRLSYNGTNATLFYDGEGNRVKKVSGGGTAVYVGGLFEIRNGEVTVHIYAGEKRVLSIKNDRKYFTHQDHLGSTALVTDTGGRLVEEIGYLPFGATLFRNAHQNGIWTSIYRYTGQEYDSEFELYNYNARLYDPVMGRFITADTLVPDWANPQTLNRYSYCKNNPLAYTDPSGNFPWAAVFFIGGFVANQIGRRNHDENLATFGSMVMGVAGGWLMPGAGGAHGAILGGYVAAATSPMSPLPPEAKMVVGWAYTAYAVFQSAYTLANEKMAAANNLSDADKALLIEAQKQIAENGRLSGSVKAEIDAIFSGDYNSFLSQNKQFIEHWTELGSGFVGSNEQVYYALEVVKRSGAENPMMAILRNPSGGMTGPGVGEWYFPAGHLRGPIGMHAAVHDAVGYVGTMQGKIWSYISWQTPGVLPYQFGGQVGGPLYQVVSNAGMYNAAYLSQRY